MPLFKVTTFDKQFRTYTVDATDKEEAEEVALSGNYEPEEEWFGSLEEVEEVEEVEEESTDDL